VYNLLLALFGGCLFIILSPSSLCSVVAWFCYVGTTLGKFDVYLFSVRKINLGSISDFCLHFSFLFFKFLIVSCFRFAENFPTISVQQILR
jgi:hypothetical protein